MTRVGVTGHQNIPVGALTGIEERIRGVLRDRGDGGLVGVGSSAAGADQLFARCVLDLGGALEIVVPCEHYETTFGTEASRRCYDTLLTAAVSVLRLPFPAPSEEAFMAAGLVVADRCELLVAVWDGLPAQGFGGTADVVRYARSIDREIAILWPDGVRRA